MQTFLVEIVVNIFESIFRHVTAESKAEYGF